MNVTNLSKSLTAKLLTSTSTYEMMLLSKSIQELKIGNVSVVNSFTDIISNRLHSVFFDGSGDYLTVPASSALAMGTGDYTIEFWIYPNTTDNFTVIDNQGIGGNMQISRITGSLFHGSATPWSYTFTTGVWTHIAFSRSGSSLRLFANGQLQQTRTNSNVIGTSVNVTRIGIRHDLNYPLNGFISNLRVVKGTALYTSNFTVSTIPLTAITGTSLLIAQGADPLKDNGPNAFTATISGNTVASNLNPFDVLAPPGNLVYVEDERTIYYKNTINGTTNWESLFVPEREIYGWGNNSGGALGDGSTLNRSSPTLLLVAQNNWTYIGTNDASCFATDINGYAYAWGANAQGQLGNNSTVATTSPVSIVGLLNNWTKIVGGDARTFGLRSNGEVFGWGLNAGFRLGDATSINKSSPSKIFSDKSWTDIAAGHYHCLGIASTGELFAWGEGGGGQLGDGFQNDRSVPVRVQGNISDWSKIAGTENSSAAIRSNGQMYTWGVNDSGVLGNNTIFSRSSPHSVPYFADWKLVAGGFGHILALRNEGTLWAWGRNIEGCLADGTTINRSSPVLVIGGKTNWVNIAGFNSSASSIAIDTTGDVWVWGAGLAGLGDGFAVRRSSPVSIKPPIVDHLYQNWIQIAISENRFFALKG